MCDKNKIYRMYIIEKMTITEIAKEENISKQMVSKILKEFPEYEAEKKRRKAENDLKRKEKKREYVKHKREIEKQKKEEEERDWWAMIEKQEIHAFIISKKRKISLAQLVELSLSQYVEAGGKLKYIDPHHKPADLPKTYDIHNTILSQFRDYANEIESEKWNSKVEKEALK